MMQRTIMNKYYLFVLLSVLTKCRHFVSKELYHIHQHESFFIVRAKKNLQYKCIKWRRRMPRNVLTDSEIMLTDYITSKKYKEKLRLVKFYDDLIDRQDSFERVV